MNKESILQAMRADMIPPAWSGLWFIHKVNIDEPASGVRHEKLVTVPAGVYTYLNRLTDSTMYNETPGEIVMEDTPYELHTHLGFILSAYGRVIVTGLGLGCVVRGLLQNQNVDHVTCIENSVDVLKMVAPYMPTERLTIIEADALEWTTHNKDSYDCAWHDLWTDRESGEPHLDIWHAQLFRNLIGTVKKQGAWAMNRNARELLKRKNFPWIG